jgi:hypothetical protein
MSVGCIRTMSAGCIRTMSRVLGRGAWIPVSVPAASMGRATWTFLSRSRTDLYTGPYASLHMPALRPTEKLGSSTRTTPRRSSWKLSSTVRPILIVSFENVHFFIERLWDHAGIQIRRSGDGASWPSRPASEVLTATHRYKNVLSCGQRTASRGPRGQLLRFGAKCFVPSLPPNPIRAQGG